MDGWMNAGWPGSCGLLPRNPREPSFPESSMEDVLSQCWAPEQRPRLPAPSLQSRSRPEASPGKTPGSQRPYRTQNKGQCPRLGAEAGATPAAPRPSLLSFLLPGGSVILALEPRTFQKADRGVAQGRGAADCANREGSGQARAPLPCSHPQRALIRMLRWAAGSPHPSITLATYPPGLRGAWPMAQRPQ